jgi:hypothetical protein
MVIGLDLDQLDNVHGKDAEFENIKRKRKKKKNMVPCWLAQKHPSGL